MNVMLTVTALLVVVCAAAFGRPGLNPIRLSSHPQTVVDYFLLLPGRYFELTRSERRSLLTAGGTVRDMTHDYLLVRGDGAQPMLNVVLFRHAKQVTVAILDGGYDPPKPTLDFLRYDGKHWKNVTAQVLPQDAVPEPDDYDRLTHQLPRYGTTIHVLNSIGTREYDLVWKDGRFIQHWVR